MEAAIEAWPMPDQGIWEARGEPKHYVSSKLMIWVAVDRGGRLAAQRGERELAQRWAEIADEIHAEILESGVRDGVFRQHYETDALDASPCSSRCSASCPPTTSGSARPCEAIARDLTENGLVLRYRPEDTDDGLQGRRGPS